MFMRRLLLGVLIALPRGRRYFPPPTVRPYRPVSSCHLKLGAKDSHAARAARYHISGRKMLSKGDAPLPRTAVALQRIVCCGWRRVARQWPACHRPLTRSRLPPSYMTLYLRHAQFVHPCAASGPFPQASPCCEASTCCEASALSAKCDGAILRGILRRMHGGQNPETVTGLAALHRRTRHPPAVYPQPTGRRHATARARTAAKIIVATAVQPSSPDIGRLRGDRP